MTVPVVVGTYAECEPGYAPEFWLRPRVTVIARPQFREPAHLNVHQITDLRGAEDGERLAEYAGRICYMSQENPARRSTAAYLENILDQGHGSVLEHATYSALIEGVSRSLTHELVRHRAGFAYSQLSQRYVDESQIGFVYPIKLLENADWRAQFRAQCLIAYENYVGWATDLEAAAEAASPKAELDRDARRARRIEMRQTARAALPNATETKIVVTGNARSWRTMLELRGGEGAEAEIRRLAVELALKLSREAPAFWGDVVAYRASDGHPALRFGHHKV